MSTRAANWFVVAMIMCGCVWLGAMLQAETPVINTTNSYTQYKITAPLLPYNIWQARSEKYAIQDGI